MMQSTPHKQITINRRGLMELILACALLSLLTSVIWSWRINGGVFAAESANLATPPSLMSQIVHDQVIMLSVVMAEFFVLLAVTLAFVPMRWWLRADHIFGRKSKAASSPIQWVSRKFYKVDESEEELQDEEDIAAAFQTSTDGSVPANAGGAGKQGDKQSPGASEQAAPGQAVPIPPGAPKVNELQPQQGADATKEAEQATDADGNPLQPAASDVLNFDETEEEDDALADLANIGDILNSAFDDEVAIDPEMESLAKGLEDIEMETLRSSTHQVLATLSQ